MKHEGIRKLIKAFGEMGMEYEGKNSVVVWDYHSNSPKIKDKMTKEELELSEKARLKIK